MKYKTYNTGPTQECDPSSRGILHLLITCLPLQAVAAPLSSATKRRRGCLTAFSCRPWPSNGCRGNSQMLVNFDPKTVALLISSASQYWPIIGHRYRANNGPAMLGTASPAMFDIHAAMLAQQIVTLGDIDLANSEQKWLH